MIRHPFAARLTQPPPVLYAILDVALVEDPLAEARALLDAGVDCLQLRAKAWRAGDILDLGAELLHLARAANTPFLLNDRVDLAALLGADGVHVGAEDLSPQAARRLLGEGALVGLTAHDATEVRAAPPEVDYLGVGAVFPTSTREGASVCGVPGLTEARALTTLPLIAIGGITPENLRALQETGIAGIAAASSLIPVSLHRGAVGAFQSALATW